MAQLAQVEGHAARQPVLIVFEDLHRTISEKFSDLASGAHAAVGGPALTALGRRPISLL